MSSHDPTEAARAIVAQLTDRGHTLAVAESLTGGALCSALVDIPGASAVLAGGVVSYSNHSKSQLLGVEPELIARTGPVTAEVALAMAEGVRRVVSPGPTDWAVATTGVAGPDPDAVSGTPAGVVWIAVVGHAGSWTKRLELQGERQEIRNQAVVAALQLLSEAVAEEGTSGE